MTIVHSTTATVLVAIDISKHRHEVLISIPGKKRRCRLTITNTLEDFQRLATALASYDLPVRIKDWRRVATRYDRCPKVFLSACALAAVVMFWL